MRKASVVARGRSFNFLSLPWHNEDWFEHLKVVDKVFRNEASKLSVKPLGGFHPQKRNILTLIVRYVIGPFNQPFIKLPTDVPRATMLHYGTCGKQTILYEFQNWQRSIMEHVRNWNSLSKLFRIEDGEDDTVNSDSRPAGSRSLLCLIAGRELQLKSS